jgi:putative glutamine amidotransferase
VPAHPTIGVSSGFTDYGDYLGVALSRPLLAAGGVPVVLPYAEDADARSRLLDRVDGLLLGFGRDIDPARYGRDPHPAMTEVSAERDAFEFALVADALERRLPILGICRGMQVLNVALGGTLHRDRSEYPPAARDHPGGDWSTWDEVCAATLGRGTMPEHPSHAIEVAAGTGLAAAIGREARVNSYHHQAIAEVADRLEPIAHAGDGIVEAVTLADDARVVGVQWELQVSWVEDRRFLTIFADLVAAAAEASAAAGDGSQRAA